MALINSYVSIKANLSPELVQKEDPAFHYSQYVTRYLHRQSINIYTYMFIYIYFYIETEIWDRIGR